MWAINKMVSLFANRVCEEQTSELTDCHCHIIVTWRSSSSHRSSNVFCDRLRSEAGVFMHATPVVIWLLLYSYIINDFRKIKKFSYR